MLYEINEYIAVKQDSSFILKGKIVSIKDNYIIVHPVYDSKKYMDYLSAKVIENKKKMIVLIKSNKKNIFSNIHMISYDT